MAFLEAEGSKCLGQGGVPNKSSPSEITGPLKKKLPGSVDLPAFHFQV